MANRPVVQSPSRRVARGFTLVEVVVALTIGGLTMAVVTAIAIRQQRAFADLADAAALGAQIQDARAILPTDLRAAASGAGDIREARDTAVEFRATIASAVVCDTAPGNTVILAPASSAIATYSSIAQPIEMNDSLWAFAPNDSSEEWRPFRATGVSLIPPGPCAAGGPTLDSAARATPRTSLSASAPTGSAAGMPIRVTRPLRYSIYRASDGAWYVGQRDWNNATQRFNTIQPVAGPFLTSAQGGLRFSYLDSAGAPLATPVTNRAAIAAVRIDVRGQTRNVQRAFGPARATAAPRTDSASVIVLLRNRR